MSSNRFPAMMIGFRITRKNGSIHEGKFRFDDEVERRRFGESTKDCYIAGERIETWRICFIRTKEDNA